MIIHVTRKYITGKSKGHTNTYLYNMNEWEEAIEWAKEVSESDVYPFIILEMKTDYGQHKIFEYDKTEN